MQIFYKNFQNFKKYLISTFLLNVPPRTKILAMPLQYRTWVEFMYEILFDVFPSNQNSWVATGTTVMYNVHCTLQLYFCSTVFERAENGNAVLCNYIDFAVIFHKKKIFSTNFIIHWLRAGPKKILRAGNFGAVDTSTISMNYFLSFRHHSSAITDYWSVVKSRS